MKKIKHSFLEIPIPLFRVHCVVTWETNKQQIMSYAQKHEVEITEEKFGRDFDDGSTNSLGLCMKLGDDNSDVLVWLKERPKKSSQYGILYHELYHAVDSIKKSKSMDDEPECSAYLYEYLANKCNDYFWPISKK